MCYQKPDQCLSLHSRELAYQLDFGGEGLFYAGTIFYSDAIALFPLVLMLDVSTPPMQPFPPFSFVPCIAKTSQHPISQTTWLKVTPHCNHCNHCIANLSQAKSNN